MKMSFIILNLLLYRMIRFLMQYKFFWILQGRVMKCLELIQDLTLVSGTVTTATTITTTASVPKSPNGVLEAACLSYKSDESIVGSQTSPENKRRKLDTSLQEGTWQKLWILNFHPPPPSKQILAKWENLCGYAKRKRKSPLKTKDKEGLSQDVNNNFEMSNNNSSSSIRRLWRGKDGILRRAIY